MSWSLEVTSAPGAEPLSTAEAKAHLRVDSAFTDDDAIIDAQVEAARNYAEAFTRRAFITQTLVLWLDAFPPGNGEIILPRPPLQSVTSISYTDVDGNAQTFASSKYIVDGKREPARITPAWNVDWPDTRAIINAVSVTYVAGYGNAASDVPEAIIRAIAFLVGHLYENRESVVTGTIAIALPQAVDFMLWPYRAWMF